MDERMMSSRFLQQSPVAAQYKDIVSPDVMISSGVKEIDLFLGGFKAGNLTYVSGASRFVSRLTYQLCVTTYQMFKGASIFIDGGTTLNPYQIARVASEYQLRPQIVLSQVHISRAFTLYQLIAIITDHLEPMIQKKHPQTLIINAFPALFQDDDVRAHESITLLKKTLATLKDLTNTYQLVTLLSAPFSQRTRRYELVHWPISAEVDEILHIDIPHRCPQISFPKHQQVITLASYGQGQLSLQDFGMVI